MVALGELISPSGRRAGPSTEAPVYSVTKHSGFVPSLEYFKKQIFSRDISDYKIVEKGEFAYATIHLDEGSIGIAPERALISPMYTIFRVDTARVIPKYLLGYLKSDRALTSYVILGQGAVHRRKSISLRSLSTLEVPLPPIDEQRRIAAILDHAESVRSRIVRARNLLGTLERSAFSASFGDITSSAATAVPLREVITSIRSGTSFKCQSRPRAEAVNEPGILKLSAITSGIFKPGENKAFTSGRPSSDNEVRAGDLLMCRKNTKELVGTTSLVEDPPPNLYLPDLIYRIEFDSARVNGEFLHGAFRTRGVRRYLEAAASGSSESMANISRARLLNIKIGVPPLEKQTEYASTLRRIKTQARRLDGQLIAIDSLISSLQSRAFRGEL